MDGRDIFNGIIDSIFRSLVMAFGIGAALTIGAWELAKFLLHHIHVFWK